MNDDLAKSLLSGRCMTLVDVGAKGGTFEITRLASLTACYGFEPNPAEYRKLKSANLPHYAQIKYFPYALGACSGRKNINIMRNASLSSFRQPDWASYDRRFGMSKQYKTLRAGLEIVATEEVDVKTLDEFANEAGIGSIDFLKIDAQGTEYEVLKGAENLLDAHRIGLIKLEVNFVPVYEGQKLFGELDLFLKQHGFDLVDIVFYEDAAYQAELSPEISSKRQLNGLYESFRYSAGGDAIYCINLEGVAENERASRARVAGLILTEMGYLSFSDDVLSRYAVIADETVAQILQVHGQKPIWARLKSWLKNWLPPMARWYLQKLRMQPKAA